MEPKTCLYYAETARRKARKREALAEGEEEQKRLGETRKLGPLWEHRPPTPPEREAAQAPAPRDEQAGKASTKRVANLPPDVAAMALKSETGPGAVPLSGPIPPAVPPAARRAVRVGVRVTAAKPGAAVKTTVAMKPVLGKPVAGRPIAARATAGRPVVVRTAAGPVSAKRVARPAAPTAKVAPGRQSPARPVVRRSIVASAAAARGPKAPVSATAGALPPPPLVANEERLLLEKEGMDLFGIGTRPTVTVCPDCQHELVRVVCLGTPVHVCMECRGTWFSYPIIQDFAQRDEWFRELGPAVKLALEKPPVEAPAT